MSLSGIKLIKYAFDAEFPRVRSLRIVSASPPLGRRGFPGKVVESRVAVDIQEEVSVTAGRSGRGVLVEDYVYVACGESVGNS